MSQRIKYYGSPALKPMIDLSAYVRASGLEKSLLELIDMRVSQINQCAYCLDMHSKDARAGGETEQRLYLLSAWRETDFYTPRERAALGWAEAVTNVNIHHGVSDELWEEVTAVFSEEEIIDLNAAVIAINAWNRMAIPFRTKAGTYKAGQRS